jgi:hypothetical protein
MKRGSSMTLCPSASRGLTGDGWRERCCACRSDRARGLGTWWPLLLYVVTGSEVGTRPRGGHQATGVPTLIAHDHPYNPDVVHNDRPGLRLVQGFAQMRERRSDAEWFPVAGNYL